MVGDSVRQDIDGALAAGMRAVLLHRASAPHALADELSARVHSNRPVARRSAAVRAKSLIVVGQCPALAGPPKSACRLPGGPGHAAAAEQVQVDVKHRLPCVAVGVEDGAVAARRKFPALSQSPPRAARSRRRSDRRRPRASFSDSMCRFGMTSTCVGACGLMSLNASSSIVFVDDRAGNLAADDLAEETVGHIRLSGPRPSSECPGGRFASPPF